MSKQQTVEAICQRNRSARPEFLMRFDQQVLDSYLKRLTLIHNKRGPASIWVRPADTRAIVSRVA